MESSELKKLYGEKSNLDLFAVLESKGDYTEETITIVNGIINSRGGFEKVKEEVELELNTNSEIQELSRVANHLFEKGSDINEIKEKVNCKYLNEAEIDSLLVDFQNDFKVKKKDQKISAKSVLSGIIGGVFGGVIGGVLWGLMMIKSGRMFIIFVFGLFLLSYFFVWLFSRKSIKNKGTILITVLSVVLALIIGQLIFEIFGLEEYVN